LNAVCEYFYFNNRSYTVCRLTHSPAQQLDDTNHNESDFMVKVLVKQGERLEA